MLRTDDARRQTPDAGRWTMDARPSTPYYKLTGELKMRRDSSSNWCATDLSNKVTNDLLTITEKGQQRSSMIR